MKKLLTIVILMFISVPSYANLIVNGGFESGVNPPESSISSLYPGNTQLTGWTISMGGIDWVSRTVWQPHSGNLSIDLSATSGGLISQTFATVPGTEYAVDFWLSGNPNKNDSERIKYVEVTIADNIQWRTEFDTTYNSPENMGWVSRQLLFTANSTLSTLYFISLTNTACGPALDDISVNAVPEPATLLLLGTGMVGLVGLRRKFRG